MAVVLEPDQIKAIHQMHNGCVVRGGVGVGKTIISLAYYLTKECKDGGTILDNGRVQFRDERGDPKDLYIITTAKKRDNLDWVKEAALFGVGGERAYSELNVRLTVDSWNNIDNYAATKDAFFIFDEQRLVGSGAWVKSFYKIAKANGWILLSATPADTWMDYIPIFVANGFFKNKTEFTEKHVMWKPFSRYPQVRGFRGESHLRELERTLLVDVEYVRTTTRVVDYIDHPWDQEQFNKVWKDRWNVFKDEPIQTISELFYVLRRVVNSHESRLASVRTLLEEHPRLIIFYNFKYEVEILKQLADSIEVKQWNGQVHDELPEGDRWVYLVQYTAGSEGWNCVSTDSMVFYSLTYSYRAFEQSQGRIDRRNTPFKELHYYVLKSGSFIDKAILKSLRAKKNFNARKFVAKTEISAHF